MMAGVDPQWRWELVAPGQMYPNCGRMFESGVAAMR